MVYFLIPLIATEKVNGPRTVGDVKLINAGKILENNRTLGECKSPLVDVAGGVTTMHVVVQPSSTDKGNGMAFDISLSFLLSLVDVTLLLICFSSAHRICTLFLIGLVEFLFILLEKLWFWDHQRVLLIT